MKLASRGTKFPPTIWALLATILCGASTVRAQPAAPAAPIATCVDCHGADGIGVETDMPHLNGQPENLLTDMMNAFREGKRPPKVRIHREVPAADVAPLARHYAAQKVSRPKSPTKPELVARGQELQLKHCSDCHVDSGRDSDKEAPLVAGQSLDYLLAQMKAFKLGERKFPYLMDKSYLDLNDQDLVALAHYYAAQEQTAPQQGRRRRR